MSGFYKISVCLLLLALCSCSIEQQADATRVSQTLLVYLGGDNNLSGEAGQKLVAMQQGWQGDDCQRLVVYMDVVGSEPELLEIVRRSGVNVTRSIAAFSSENSASAEVFGRVIEQVRELYPAESYALLVFSHASGWLPQGTYNNPSTRSGETRSVIIDGKNEMNITDMAAAIPDGMFDYIAFEACFMGGIEVAFELRHKADYILASCAEIVSPGFTPAYSTSLDRLFTDNPAGFGQSVYSVVQTYASSDYRHSATYSVVRTSGLKPLADYIRTNCDLSRPVDPATVQHFDREAKGNLFFDFEDYYSQLLDTDTQREQLATLTGDCVVWKAATPTFMPTYSGFAIESFSGMTTYIPQSRYPNLNAAHRSLGWTQHIEL